MKVKKDNRILTINESEKAYYLAEGYDVVELVDGEYEVIEKATGGRTYSVAEYNALVAKLEALKAGAEPNAYQEVVDRLEDEIETLTLALEDVGNENEALKAELAKTPKTPKEFDRNEAMAYLKEKGVEFAGNISNDNLKKLLKENA